jgi:ABC-type nitrate/sulfonate/bicarbonate transport system ATPase subunit
MGIGEMNANAVKYMYMDEKIAGLDAQVREKLGKQTSKHIMWVDCGRRWVCL